MRSKIKKEHSRREKDTGRGEEERGNVFVNKMRYRSKKQIYRESERGRCTKVKGRTTKRYTAPEPTNDRVCYLWARRGRGERQKRRGRDTRNTKRLTKKKDELEIATRWKNKICSR